MNGELYKIETNNFVKNTITLTDMFIVSKIWNPINIKLRDTFIISKLSLALQNPTSFSVAFAA